MNPREIETEEKLDTPNNEKARSLYRIVLQPKYVASILSGTSIYHLFPYIYKQWKPTL